MSEHFLSDMEWRATPEKPFHSTAVTQDIKESIQKIQLPKEEDPWGNIPGVVLLVAGDSHIPREEPMEEPTMAVYPYTKISRIDPRNPKRYAEDRQTRFASTWFAEVQEMKQQLEASKQELQAGYVPLVVHVGDRGSDGEQAGDMQNALWTVASGLESLKEESPKVKIAMLSGDHEFDHQRHGDAVRKEEMSLLGEKPAFFQRVGTKHMLLGVATSLTPPQTDDQMVKWKKHQDELVKKAAEIAKKEGRGVILLGHKANELVQMAQEYGIPAEAILAGHKHLGSTKVEKDGTVRGTVGAPTFGAFGLEVNVKPSFLKMNVGDNGKLTPTSIKVNPNKIEGLM